MVLEGIYVALTIDTSLLLFFSCSPSTFAAGQVYFHDPDAKLTLQFEDPFTMSSGGRHETTLNSVKTESTATEILDRNGSAIVTATPVKSSVASSECK